MSTKKIEHTELINLEKSWHDKYNDLSSKFDELAGRASYCAMMYMACMRKYKDSNHKLRNVIEWYHDEYSKLIKTCDRCFWHGFVSGIAAELAVAFLIAIIRSYINA